MDSLSFLLVQIGLVRSTHYTPSTDTAQAYTVAVLGPKWKSWFNYDMKIETNLQGRLRNTSLPQSSGLMPVFEAVINSVHAIEEADISSEAGLIRVSIDRAAAQHRLADPNNKKPGPEPLGDIRGFAITDNGIGFNDTNFSAFLTLDTDHKVRQGGARYRSSSVVEGV